MIELGVTAYKSIVEFAGEKKGIGSKPLITFQGEQWQNDSLYAKIQSILLDMFRGDQTEKISLQGIDHVLSFTCTEDGKILMRAYCIGFQKSDSKVYLAHDSLHLLNELTDL